MAGLGWVLSEVCLSLDGEGLRRDEGVEVLREILFSYEFGEGEGEERLVRYAFVFLFRS